jgi:hypothetical protein
MAAQPTRGTNKQPNECEFSHASRSEARRRAGAFARLCLAIPRAYGLGLASARTAAAGRLVIVSPLVALLYIRTVLDLNKT